MTEKKLPSNIRESLQYAAKDSLREFGIQAITDGGTYKMIDPHSEARYIIHEQFKSSSYPKTDTLFKSRIHFI